jgi:hypothetical protein
MLLPEVRILRIQSLHVPADWLGLPIFGKARRPLAAPAQGMVTVGSCHSGRAFIAFLILSFGAHGEITAAFIVLVPNHAITKVN